MAEEIWLREKHLTKTQTFSYLFYKQNVYMAAVYIGNHIANL